MKIGKWRKFLRIKNRGKAILEFTVSRGENHWQTGRGVGGNGAISFPSDDYKTEQTV